MQDDNSLDSLFDENPVGHYEDFLEMEEAFSNRCCDCKDEEIMVEDAISEDFPF